MPRVARIKTWDERRMEFVRNHLRKVSILWPAGKEARQAARTVQKINPETGRKAWHAECAGCQVEVPEKKLALDHVEPVVEIRSWDENPYGPNNLGALVSRMFPDPDGYQMLCFQCHTAKTEAENEARGVERKANVKQIVGKFMDENDQLMRNLATSATSDRYVCLVCSVEFEKERPASGIPLTHRPHQCADGRQCIAQIIYTAENMK